MKDCLFCKMAHGEIKTDIIFQTKDVFVLNDISPQAPKHMLIIPFKHIATLNEINETDSLLLGEMLQTAKHLAQKYAFADSGYRTVFNCNSAGGQAIYHIHLHLLGGRQLNWPPG